MDDTTPTVFDIKECVISSTVATTITDFDDGYDGQEFIAVFTTNNTTIEFSNVILIGNAGVDKVMGTGDAIKAVHRKSTGRWYITVIDI